MNKELTREATPKEAAWCRKLARVMRQKPDSIYLFANGILCALPSEMIGKGIGGGMPQPLIGVPDLGRCDGGDF